MNMRNALLFLGAVLLMVICIGICSPRDPEPQSTATATNQDSALAAVLREPKVTDAVVTDAHVLYVSVQDDGSRRDGYAEYICQILADYHATATRVKIVAAGSAQHPKRDNAYGILLGEAVCE